MIEITDECLRAMMATVNYFPDDEQLAEDRKEVERRLALIPVNDTVCSCGTLISTEGKERNGK